MKKGIRKVFPNGAKETKMRPATVAALIACQCLMLFLFFMVQTWASCLAAGLMVGFFSTRLSHEASHMQASAKPWVNRLLMWFGYLPVSPSMCWYYRHVISHHPHTNERDHDVDVAAIPILDQLPPQLQWMKVVSIPIIFTSTPFSIGLGTLFDILSFRSVGNNYVNLNVGGLMWETILWFALHYSFGPPLLCYLCMWFSSGLVFVTFSQIAHAVLYPDASPAAGWAEQQMRTSINFAPRSSFWYHAAFGLTTQVDHHLFPGIGAHCLDDVHDYVVKPVCKKYNIPVYDATARKALGFLWQRLISGKPVKLD
jgi:linoleoyl-CoA desaturase